METGKRKLHGVSAIRGLLGTAATAIAAVTAIAVATACAGPAGPEPSLENEPSRTHVVATLERQTVSGQATQGDLSILLSVLRIPQSLNGDRLLRLMGLRADLPPPGSCEVIDLTNRASPSLSSVERIEFLDVGDVSVVSGGRSMRLARQAFPTVTDFIAGVVYTSRDKNDGQLPLDAGVLIRARGSGKIRPFAVEIAHRPALNQVLLDGAPFSSVHRLSVVNGFELRWDAGAAGDVLWLEWSANDGRKMVSCAFDDAAGLARVPGGMTDEFGESRLTLHRLHSARIDVPAVDAAEIQFDSRLTQLVTLH